VKIKWSFRSIWHYVIGGFAGFTWVWSPSLPPTILGGFIAYEVKQDRDLEKTDRKDPDSHLDIYEAVFALPFGVGLGVGLRFLGVI